MFNTGSTTVNAAGVITANTGGTNLGLGTVGPTSSAEGTQWPDIVAALRLDGTWGSAQIMGALHDASGQYYSTGITGLPCTSATTTCGNPSNAVGWAVGGGFKWLTPMIGQGDYFQLQVNYSQGASGYVSASANNNYSQENGGFGGNLGYGLQSDSVYGIINGGGQDIQLTTMWGVNAAYEHFWSPHWQTSIYGAYIKASYNSTANTMLCADQFVRNATGWTAAAGTSQSSCDNSWNYWNVGTRTQWNIDSQTYIGVDVMYTSFQTANNGISATIPVNGTQPSALRTFSDQSAFVGQFRVHRNFYP